MTKAFDDCYIGLMSGTSLDGIDAAMVQFSPDLRIHATARIAIPDDIKQSLLALHSPGGNDLHAFAILGQRLAHCYAQAVNSLKTQIPHRRVRAIGCHGQTVRHCPEHAYSIQVNAPALLAELTNTTVVADFRSRDLAAGGQGAPLVPAFHAKVFSHPVEKRVIVNLGGIANITRLIPGSPVIGFDTGPANILLDAWIAHCHGLPFDDNGRWAQSGTVLPLLLKQLYATDFFSRPPPKSTGRDLFSLAWLQQHVNHLATPPTPEDIQATLLELTCVSISQAIAQYASTCESVWLCGGGAYNSALRQRLATLLPRNTHLYLTDMLGIAPEWVEATAFAWLAQACLCNEPSNLPEVTGAEGSRILGAIYPG